MCHCGVGYVLGVGWLEGSTGIVHVRYRTHCVISGAPRILDTVFMGSGRNSVASSYG